MGALFDLAKKELADAGLLTSDKTVNSQLVVFTVIAIILHERLKT